jgi:hypothetical protein
MKKNILIIIPCVMMMAAGVDEMLHFLMKMMMTADERL